MHDPEKYESFKSFTGRDAFEFTPQLVQEMKWSGSKEIVMDYGCGAGSIGYKFILPEVERTNSQMISVDMSESMLNYAREKYSSPRITYRLGNILEEGSFQENHFDKIFSINVLDLIKDYRGLVQQFFKVLKPGGSLGIAGIVQGQLYEDFKELADKLTDKWGEEMKTYNNFIPEWVEKGEDAALCFKKALTEAGFQISKLELHSQTWDYAQVEQYAEFLLALKPFKGDLSESQQRELKEDYMNLLCKRSNIPNRDGPFQFKYDMLYFIANKPE